ncbi:MAG: hypothetical protein K2M07_03770, partial [Muribaculaceae bacterium]|nr:hypothetical protein [Muribaculaceae bacterium]
MKQLRNVKNHTKICTIQKLSVTLQSFRSTPKDSNENIERFTIDKSSTRANKTLVNSTKISQRNRPDGQFGFVKAKHKQDVLLINFEKRENKITTTKSLILAQDE